MKKTPQQLSEMALIVFPRLINDPYNPMEDDNKESRDIWINGYQVCQEEMKQVATDYAKFCIRCERDGLPLLDFDSYINLDPNL